MRQSQSWLSVRRILLRWLPKRVVRALVMARLPRVANVEATTACDLGCPLCPTHVVTRSTRYLSGPHVDGILNGDHRLRDVCFHVQGEPLMHPRLFEFIDRFAACGVRTHFGSNGNRLLERVDEVMDSNLDSIAIAMDGADQAEYQRYRVGGSLEKVKGGVIAVLAARKERKQETPMVELQVIEFPYLRPRMSEIRSELEELGADRIRVKKATLEIESDQFLSRAGEAKVERGMVRARKFLASLGPRGTAPRPIPVRPYRDDPICSQLEKATVLADGRVVACCMDAEGETTFGDVGQDTLTDVWKSPEHADVIRSFQAGTLRLCSVCTLAHSD